MNMVSTLLLTARKLLFVHAGPGPQDDGHAPPQRLPCRQRPQRHAQAVYQLRPLQAHGAWQHHAPHPEAPAAGDCSVVPCVVGAAFTGAPLPWLCTPSSGRGPRDPRLLLQDWQEEAELRIDTSCNEHRLDVGALQLPLRLAWALAILVRGQTSTREPYPPAGGVAASRSALRGSHHGGEEWGASLGYPVDGHTAPGTSCDGGSSAGSRAWGMPERGHTTPSSSCPSSLRRMDRVTDATRLPSPLRSLVAQYGTTGGPVW